MKETDYEKASQDIQDAVGNGLIDFSARIEEMNSLFEVESNKRKRESRWKISGLVFSIIAIAVAIFVGWESVLNLLSAIAKSLT